jgi:hypothetical protein
VTKPVAGKDFPEISISIFHYPLSTTFRKLSGNFPESVLNDFPLSNLMEINGKYSQEYKKKKGTLLGVGTLQAFAGRSHLHLQPLW